MDLADQMLQRQREETMTHVADVVWPWLILLIAVGGLGALGYYVWSMAQRGATSGVAGPLAGRFKDADPVHFRPLRSRPRRLSTVQFTDEDDSGYNLEVRNTSRRRRRS
jgi:nitrate reductase NapE component